MESYTGWSIERIKSLIQNEVEERHDLEYKSSGSLAKSDGKKTEITKDVSAFANSSGGVIVYGISEHSSKSKNHLPQSIDPIDRSTISREWMDQVIGNIEPRIPNIKIIPITVEDEENNVVYVVEIPKSNTAHQAKNLRYYRRYNFESVPMRDFEIRDVMNRSIKPNADLEISYQSGRRSAEKHHYKLNIIIKNTGDIVINDFKVKLEIPNFGNNISHKKVSRDTFTHFGYISGEKNDNNDHIIEYYSAKVLFPEDIFDLGYYLDLNYIIDNEAYHEIKTIEENTAKKLEWTLFADDMNPKRGSELLSNLHEF